MQEVSHDVVIVGAGFAGVTAARDLAKEGRSVVVLEARDRIGGRTYSVDQMGRTIELGGTYVHWTWAHLWREMNRLGIGFNKPFEVDKISWIAGGEMHSGTAEEYDNVLAPVAERFFADALTAFPQSYNPSLADFSAIDAESIADRYRKLELSDAERDVLEGSISTLMADPEDQGVAEILIWAAHYFGNWRLVHQTGGHYSIAGGTGALLNALVEESGADFRLSTPVASIDDHGDRVVVTTRDGETFVGKAVIVAVPLNTMGDIAITPAVSKPVQAFIDAGHGMRSVKVLVRVKGELEPFGVYTPLGEHPLTAITAEYWTDGDTFLTCFGSDPNAIDYGDKAAIQKALQALIPGIEVVDTAWHNWSEDEFAKGTWIMMSPGHMSGLSPEIRKPHGRIRFAGGDISHTFPGSIEGAMQSATGVASELHQFLS